MQALMQAFDRAIPDSNDISSFAIVAYDSIGWGGIRTLGTLRYTRSPGVPNRPLWHPSNAGQDIEANGHLLQLILGAAAWHAALGLFLIQGSLQGIQLGF